MIIIKKSSRQKAGCRNATNGHLLQEAQFLENGEDAFGDSFGSGQFKKVLHSKINDKDYTVSITLIKVTDEEARMKRSIIEQIIKKSCYF